MTDPNAIKNNPFKELGEIPSLKYNGEYTVENLQVEVRDGTKIAITVCLPKDLKSNEKLPTVLIQTRYWRAMELRIPFRWIFDEAVSMTPNPDIITSRGYAFIITDVRGTGASFGTRLYPFSEEEVKDGYDIVEWIISQPWSNGKIVSKGISYTGTTAELFAANKHPAIKAVMPGHGFWDPYTDVAFPGGVYDHAFMELWSFLGKNLDLNNPKVFRQIMPEAWVFVRGVKPINSDVDLKLLERAKELHSKNEYVFDNTQDKSFRDELLPDGTGIDDISVFRRKIRIEESKIPMLIWCSWYDSGYCDAAIHKFLNLNNSMIVILGDWNHGASLPANQFHPERLAVTPTPRERIHAWMNFFDKCVFANGIKNKILYYYTMVEEAWKKTTKWPPEGSEFKRLYFNENFELTFSPPTNEQGIDEYKVNYRASSGRNNRWYALLGLPIIYQDREKEDKRLLCYISSPFNEDREITGQVIVNLFVSSTHSDGALFVYLEDVDEEGRVTYITDGEFRLIHRKVSDTPLYKILIPYHSYKKEDMLPLIPGEINEIKFALHVTSVLIKKGHRLKVAIAGCDKDTFNRYPSEGRPVINLARNEQNASYIELPIIKRRNE
ncbi:MAG: CocE/NonD family hydrolase [Promethearchaeota archaeon]|nr:MAG: CocE/NonD family hydrolase [Candidatus Lokiarchaeota archaeon]